MYIACTYQYSQQVLKKHFIAFSFIWNNTTFACCFIIKSVLYLTDRIKITILYIVCIVVQFYP